MHQNQKTLIPTPRNDNIAPPREQRRAKSELCTSTTHVVLNTADYLLLGGYEKSLNNPVYIVMLLTIFVSNPLSAASIFIFIYKPPARAQSFYLSLGPAGSLVQGPVRQGGVIRGVGPGRHDQAALGVI